MQIGSGCIGGTLDVCAPSPAATWSSAIDVDVNLARVIRRIADSALWLLPGAVAAWATLLGFQLLTAPGRWGVLAAGFAAGTLAGLTLVLLALTTLIVAAQPARWSAARVAPAAVAPAPAWRWPAVVAGALALALLLHWPAHRIAEALVPALDTRSSFVSGSGWALALLAGVAAGTALGGGASLWAIALVAWRLIARADLGVAFAHREMWLELATLVGLFVTLAPAARRLVARAPHGRRVLAVAAGAMPVTLTLLLGLLGARQVDRAAFVASFPGVAPYVSIARGALDFDGDGYAAVLGGMDCDDTDPEVSPSAYEQVGNGRDDNCIGGDLASWAPPAEGPAQTGAPRRSVVLITVDALRADMLAPGQMDQLLAFAAGGANFSRAYAPACFTDFALRAVMTGHLPMDFSDGSLFFGQEPSLAERFADAGYATVAIHSIWLLNPYALQGFADVDDSLAVRNRGFRGQTAAATSDKAVAAFTRLRAGGQPFFLWVHYFDPHSDYVAVAGAPDFGPGARGRYRQEVWSTDRELGRLLETIVASGFLDDNLVAVTADHGELLGEHEHFGHAHWVAEQALRVPLVLRGHGVPAGGIDVRVRSIDLFATLLEHGLGVTPAADGASLFPVLAGSERADRDVIAVGEYAGEFMRVAISGGWKLVQDVRGNSEYLYRVDEDPGEVENLVDRQPAEAARLRQLMGAAWDRALNDLALTRKIQRLGNRELDEQRMRNWSRQVLQNSCAHGQAAACDQLRALEVQP